MSTFLEILDKTGLVHKDDYHFYRNYNLQEVVHLLRPYKQHISLHKHIDLQLDGREQSLHPWSFRIHLQLSGHLILMEDFRVTKVKMQNKLNTKTHKKTAQQNQTKA